MILVVGATGNVGRKVVETLLKDPQNQIRVLARGKNDWEGSILPSFRRRSVDVVVGDVRSQNTVSKAVLGCKAIINCSGVMRANAEDDLAAINVDGVANLVDAGQEVGVQRFVQLSCLGATEHATSLYFSTKWEAEEVVRKSSFYWTIFRPSLIFDRESSLLRILEFWVQRSPLTIVVGSGLNRFQPVSADDVAACLVQSLYDKDTVAKTYELPGPETIDLQSLLSTIALNSGRTARILRIPSFLGLPLSALIGKLNPRSPIDNNVMAVMTSEMISEDTGIVRKFKIERQRLSRALKAIAASRDEEEEDED
ncbi:MAG: NAD(P)H-binding protein [Candidatus Obscuribacterales bacterium]|nr:NAD(P)H-binding protein [Candidatus Obscuribacterales bacterium]